VGTRYPKAKEAPVVSGKVTLSVRITEELDEWARDEVRLRERTVGEIVEAALKDAKEKAE
jgi:hypothetical protein